MSPLHEWPAESLRAFFTFAPELYGIADAEGRFEAVSPSFVALLGWTEAELIGRPLLSLVHPADLQPALQAFGEAALGATESPFECRYAGKDGAYRWLSWRVQAFGAHTYVVATDLTEAQGRHAATLHEASERFRTAFEHAAIGKALVAADGAWLEVNAALCTLVGYTTAELRAKTFQDITHPDDLDADLGLAGQVYRGERVSYQLEKRYLHREGRIVWVLLSVSAVRGPEGDFRYFLSEVQDISAQKQAFHLAEEHTAALARANAALEASRDAAQAGERAKSVFLAIMGHEVRAPLSALLRSVERLSATDLDGPQRVLATRIGESGAALRALIEDVLDLSRIEAGGVELAQKPFELRPLVGALVDTLRAQALGKGVALNATVDASVPGLLRGDAPRIRQMLGGYLSNAIRHTERGAIEVFAAARPVPEAPTDVLLHVYVSDTGTGIPAAQMGGLFQSYGEAEPHAPCAERGGLGLALVKRLAGLMGGEVWAASVEGAGSTFHFTARLGNAIPAVTPRAQTPSRSARSVDPALPAGLRLLIVEDVPESRALLKVILQRAGLRADEAQDGAQAVEAAVAAAAAGAPYDVVFMDVMMPVMNGFEATRRIRETLPREAQPRIIAVTADTLAGDLEKCISVGMDLYITKPYTPRRLLKALAQAVSLRTGAR